jgi:hypothetical protein
VIALQVALVLGIAVLSVVGVLAPEVVPPVPAPQSSAAWALFAVGLLMFAAVAVRAAHTYLLTRRVADLVVVMGLVLLAVSLYGALVLSFTDLGWWLGHLFEVVESGSSAPPRPTTCAAADGHARSAATFAPPRSWSPRRPTSAPACGR